MNDINDYDNLIPSNEPIYIPDEDVKNLFKRECPNCNTVLYDSVCHKCGFCFGCCIE